MSEKISLDSSDRNCNTSYYITNGINDNVCRANSIFANFFGN